MNDNKEKIQQLLSRLEIFEKRQDALQADLEGMRQELKLLQNSESPTPHRVLESAGPLVEKATEARPEVITVKGPVIGQPRAQRSGFSTFTKDSGRRSNLEKFIGENLISKIGIIITIIGVAVGAKYAIDHELISPLTRIILGYLFGLGLLGTGAYLKKNYFNFSAVLVSGALAILYFITYAAYDIYHLIPQSVSFAMMVLFTAFAIVASLNYNLQVIALIGLVGAYAVPYLLSNDSGNAFVLFSYMTIINVGIMIIAFQKYWKPLYYAAFIFTWLIFAGWFMTSYNSQSHWMLAFVFLAVFFVLFYILFLACKLLQNEKLVAADIMLILSNSFIFYGFGYVLMLDLTDGDKFVGLFTLGNAIVHFAVTTLIFNKKLGDRNLFYFVSGLVLIFITIAVPVQMDGNWVTLLWAGEAALLFWIGRTKEIAFYEKLSYTLMILAFFSLLQDWTSVYDGYIPEKPETRIPFLFNIHFLSSLLFIGAFAFINLVNRKPNHPSAFSHKKNLMAVISFALPAILVISLFYAFRMEISTYWQQMFLDSGITVNPEGQEYPDYFYNDSLQRFRTIWIINYAMLFFALLSMTNVKKINGATLAYITLAINAMMVLVFLVGSLYEFSELRQSYLTRELAEYYTRGFMHIGIRYVSFLFFAALLMGLNQVINSPLIRENLRKPFYLMVHTALIWVASSEVIHWMNMAGSEQSYKLGLSILWGVYALFLVVLGIWKKAPYLRFGAIVLFGVTLVKLFFYDIAHLGTIAITVVFVSLGVLMLIISFLYNKYRNLISGEDASE